MKRTVLGAIRSVHFVDSETISRQMFAPDRYNLPLFLCQKLNVAKRETDGGCKTGRSSAKEQHRSELLNRMRKYQGVSARKGTAKSPSERTNDCSQRKCAAHRQKWPRCPAALRNSSKDWFLPPGRYRLSGSIAGDSVNNLSTGAKQGQQVTPPHRTFKEPPGKQNLPPRTTTTTARIQELPFARQLHEHSASIPTEMNKLSHPRKYFVGKIRPGDRMKDRATSRMVIAEPTLCRRNPEEPGPGYYDPYRADSRDTGKGRKFERQRKRPVCGLGYTYTYDRYCREPFFRPPPGRYDLRPALPPVGPRPAGAQSRYIGIFRSVPPERGTCAALRLNSINIPAGPRLGRRNRKVAFLSGTARFRDREFFPLGALTSRLAASGSRRRAADDTSKRASDASGKGKLAEEDGGGRARGGEEAHGDDGDDGVGGDEDQDSGKDVSSAGRGGGEEAKPNELYLLRQLQEKFATTSSGHGGIVREGISRKQ